MGSMLLLLPPPLLFSCLLNKLHLSYSQNIIHMLCTKDPKHYNMSPAKSNPKQQRKVMSLEEKVGLLGNSLNKGYLQVLWVGCIMWTKVLCIPFIKIRTLVLLLVLHEVQNMLLLWEEQQLWKWKILFSYYAITNDTTWAAVTWALWGGA